MCSQTQLFPPEQTKIGQWQITALEQNGQLDFCGQYATKQQAEQALARLKQHHPNVTLQHIGGQSDA